MKLKAVIFDMDGVIVDTVPIHFEAWKRMFADYGVDFTFEDYKHKVDGIPRTDGAKAILTELSEQEIEEAATKKQDYFLKAIDEIDIPTYPSTIKLIDDLKKNNIKVGVISSSKNAPHILERILLTDKLDTVVSGHDITKGKPDPQIFLMAAKKMDVPADGCVVVEDAVLGVEAANNAKMKCIGIDRYNDPNRLKMANIIVKDLEEIDIQTLENLFN